jgi:hypothetical protein
MPKVETYSLPTVAPRSMGNPTQRLDSRGAFGEAIGEALGQNAKILTDVALDIKQKDDEATVKQAVSELRNGINKRTYLDEDGYYNRQGQAAYKSYPEMQRELTEMRRKTGESLTPDQQRAYSQLSQQYLDREFDSMSKHAAKGRRTWQNEQDESIILQAQEDGSLRWSDNVAEAGQIRKAVDNLANRNGWSPERKEAETEKYLSGLHKSAIDNMIAGKHYAAAKQYWADNNAEVAGSLHDEIVAKLEGSANAAEAQAVADEIRIGGGSIGERLSLVNEIEDPEVRKLVRSQVEHDIKWEKQAEIEERADIYEEVAKGVSKAKRISQITSRRKVIFRQVTRTKPMRLSNVVPSATPTPKS